MTSLSKFLNCGGPSSPTPHSSQCLMTGNHNPLLSTPLSVGKNVKSSYKNWKTKINIFLARDMIMHGFLKKCYHTRKSRHKGEFSFSSFVCCCKNAFNILCAE